MEKPSWFKLFVDGEWTGSKDRTVHIKGVETDIDEWSKQHGIELPEGKKAHKQINKVEEQHADLDRSGDTSDTEES